MKACRKFIFATLAATAALAACTKEITPPNFENDKINPAAEGTRVIAVSFGSQTKTRLDGLQPKFVNEKDTILLYTVPEDENEPLLTDTCVVKVDGSGKATIYTDLTGKLKAIYPAKAAVLEDNVITAEILAIQSGKFADANIAGADINENNSAQFENAAPLLIITPPSGTKKLIVRSLRTIGEDGQRSEMACPINTSAEEKEQCTITVLNPDNDGRYYVTLYFDYDVKLSDLSFEAWFDEGGTTGSIKGIPEKKIKEQAAATGLKDYEIIQPGTAYTIDDKNWHEYVEVGGKRWATMNLGANTVADSYETCCGDYYAWGETEPYYDSRVWAETLKTWNITKWKEGKEGGYCWQSYCKKDSFEEWIPAPYDNTSKILTSVYDVVQKKVGGGWRMPTSAEFVALANACIGDCNMDDEGEITPAVLANPSEKDPVDQGIYWCNNYEGAAGLLFVDAKGVELFFPAMGFYKEQKIDYLGYKIGVSGCYLASDLAEDDWAFSMFFTKMKFTVEDSGYRCFGCCIRPVSGELAEPADEEESPATEMTEEVLF